MTRRPPGRLLGCAAIAIAALSGCASPAADRPNLILITLDTTRADRLGCYGATSVETPHLDRIASHGTVFDHAYAVAPITAPSHASMLSGTFPPFHQVRDNDLVAVPDGLPWLPEILREHGYTTAAMIAAFPLRSAMGFARGFDYFGDQLEAPPGSFVITNLHSVGVASRPGERISEEFERWLGSRTDSAPFFVWLHYYDPHWPWQAGGGYAELYPDEPYDGEIAYMDDSIGKVLRALNDAGIADRTGLVVVADHGEGLMDHGELTHALLLYNPTLRVPLIVQLPWLESQRPRVPDFVSNADVMPTILDGLGIEPTALGLPIQGRSLLPALAAASASGGAPAAGDRLLYFETFYSYYHYRWSPLTGFLEDGRKYIHGPFDELYDLRDDPGETESLAAAPTLADHAARLDRLAADLRRGRPATSRRQQSREELAQLRALGYVGGAPTEDPELLDDLSGLVHPRDAMPIFYKYNDILGLIQARRLAEALALAASIADADPNQKDARLTVASLSVELGRFDAASQAFTELIEDFSDKDVLYQAGVYFQYRGDLPLARQCFERLVFDDPEDVEAVTRLAETAMSGGDLGEAGRLFEQALTIDPWYRDAMLGHAVLLDRQESPEAGRIFESTAARYPLDPRVNFDYGIFLLRHGREAEGVDRLRRTTALASRGLFAAAQFALAAHFERRGDLDQARACLREVVLQTDNPAALRQAQERLAALGGG